MCVDVNRPKGKNVERRLTGEKTQRLWALTRVHTIVKWAMVGRYFIAGDYYVRSAVLEQGRANRFFCGITRVNASWLNCDARAKKCSVEILIQKIDGRSFWIVKNESLELKDYKILNSMQRGPELEILIHVDDVNTIFSSLVNLE